MKRLSWVQWVIGLALCAFLVIAGGAGERAEAANLSWDFDPDTGTLVISGSGAMDDYKQTTSGAPPWNSVKGDVKMVTIKSGVTSIGDFAFAQCAQLTYISLPDGITRIGDYAFYGCESLGDIVLPEGTKSIGYEAFRLCGALSIIALPNSLTELGEAAFYECAGLGIVYMSEGVSRIGAEAFGGSPKVRIMCAPLSVARQYAIDNGLDYFSNGWTWTHRSGQLIFRGYGDMPDSIKTDDEDTVPWREYRDSARTV
ncbi:MAG: leucine-rich repeat domain-containing protein, partial [Oscillospiraceae bacterium]|nr:leucine-rich repeat domain-containing protein [Oscillospiraceae bacterium]